MGHITTKRPFRTSFATTNPPQITPIQNNDKAVSQVKMTKLLGVIISDDLTWNEHILNITKKQCQGHTTALTIDVREHVQRQALHIILSELNYNVALESLRLKSLNDRRVYLCKSTLHWRAS